MFKFFPKIKQNNISFTSDKWIWGYKYNYEGQREQKRLLKSPHGDDGTELQSFAHNWEYCMNGAFGEEVVQYKGFQTTAEVVCILNVYVLILTIISGINYNGYYCLLK